MSNYKPELSLDELIEYELSINDSMDEEFLRNYIQDEYGLLAKAVLKEIPIESIKPSANKDNHLKNESTQKKYNKQSNLDPILVHDDLSIVDGHHRYRAHKFQKKDSILAYVLQ